MSTNTFIALVVAVVAFVFRRRPLLGLAVLGVLYANGNRIAAFMYRRAGLTK